MKFSIPKTGYKVGTCGWLASGLADGSIRIAPGTTKSGKGGLWIHTPLGSECLAIFNEFGLSEDEFRGANRFSVVAQEFCDSLPLTESATKYLQAIASDWCEVANSDREADGVDSLPKFAIV